MAGQPGQPGQTVRPTNPMDQGRYVGNPNHSNIQNTAMRNPDGSQMGGGSFTFARPPQNLIDPKSPDFNPDLKAQYESMGRTPNIGGNSIGGGSMQLVGKDGNKIAPTPEYLKGFQAPGVGSMDSRQYTLNGQNMTGGSTYIAALTKHLESIGQGNLLKGGTYTPTAQPPTTIAPPAPGVQPPTTIAPPAPGVQFPPSFSAGNTMNPSFPGHPDHAAYLQNLKASGGVPPNIAPPAPGVQPPTTIAPQAPQPNINQMAVDGLKAAGATTGQGLSFTPQQVAVAGNSATVNPTNVVGSDVVNANVVGSNIAAQQVGAQAASPTVMAERLANTDMSQYMNPYTDQVIAANEKDTRRAANMGLDMLGAQAQAAGGFGGSRHGIAMGEIGRGLTDTLGRQSAGLRQAGYQNAQQMAGQDISNNFQSQMANQQGGQFDVSTNMQGQLANQGASLQASQQNQQNALQAALANQSAGMQSGLANQSNALNSALSNQNYNFQGQRANQQAGQQDIQNRLQAALANQSAGLSGNSQRMGAANQMGNLANLGFDMGQTVNNNMMNQGAMQQALQQAIMDAGQNKFNQYTGYGSTGLGYMGGALGVVPAGINNSTLSKKQGLFDYLTLGAQIMGG